MLSSAALLTTPDLSVRDLHCAHARGALGRRPSSRAAPRSSSPRRGSFRRRGTHGDDVIEPGVAYFQRAGEEEEFAHPHDGGDRCTSIGLSRHPARLAARRRPDAPGGRRATTPQRRSRAPPPRRDTCASRVGPLSNAPVTRSASSPRHHVLAAARPRARRRRPPGDAARPPPRSPRRPRGARARPPLGLLDLARARRGLAAPPLARLPRRRSACSISTYRRRLRAPRGAGADRRGRPRARRRRRRASPTTPTSRARCARCSARRRRRYSAKLPARCTSPGRSRPSTPASHSATPISASRSIPVSTPSFSSR